MPKRPASDSGGPEASQGSASRARQRSQELRSAQAAADKRRRLLWQLGLFGVVAVVAVLLTVAVLAGRDGGGSGTEAAPDGVTSDGSIVVGPESAPVTITMIEDFQCPACAQFEAANQELLDSYAASDDVRLEYRPIAFLDNASSTEYSSRALNAAACFVDQRPDDWRAFHQTLYEQQPPEGSAGLSDAQLVELGVGAGASESSFSACVEERRFRGWAEETTQRALDLPGFEGTPTVEVNGTKVDTPTPENLQAAVEAASGQ